MKGVNRLFGRATGCAGVALLVVVLAHTGAQAQSEIRVSFTGNYGGFGNWNLVDIVYSMSADDLTEYNSGDSLVSDLTMSGWTHTLSGPQIWPHVTCPWLNNPGLAQGGALRYQLGVSTIVLDEMVGPWQVELISASTQFDDGTRLIQDITINGQFADADQLALGENGDDYNSVVQGTQNGNWLIWDHVWPDNGQLTIQLDSTGVGDGNVVNAMRLVQVPEPTSLLLTGLGGALLWLRRR